MKLDAKKIYMVRRYKIEESNDVVNLGCMSGSDVKTVIGTAKYDPNFEMWFTPKATIAYDIKEVK